MNTIHEDKQQLQNIIQCMGNSVASILPTAWSKVVIGYFIIGEDQVSHFQLHVATAFSDDYIDLMEESWDSDELDDVILEIQQLCKNMRKICVSANDCWTVMTFCMQTDGSFNIDYGYRPIEEYDSKYILTWQSQYLN